MDGDFRGQCRGNLPRLSPVYTPHKWPLDRLLQLLSALMLCLATGMIVHHLVLFGGMIDTVEGRLLATIIHVAFFNVGGFLCVGWLLTLEKISWAEGFGLKQGPCRAICLGLTTAVLVTPVVMLLQGLMAKLLTVQGAAPKVQEMVKVIKSTVNFDQQLFYGVVAIILAPVIEELFFRGILYPAIKSRGYPKAALFGTSLLFALVHSNMLTFIPLTVLALVLIGLYEWTGNLLAPILLHSGFNAINFCLLLYREEFMLWLKSVLFNFYLLSYREEFMLWLKSVL